jgi:hypothetical protein
MNSRAWLRLYAFALATALLGAAPAGFAQTASPPTAEDKDHGAHHPPAASEAPSPAPSQPSGMPMGMIGQGGPTGMMGGNMKEMMSRMRDMMTMMSAQSGMMASNVEGRIASLKTELKITEAQAPQWARFADALRATAGSMNGMYQQVMQPGVTGTLAARLDRQDAMLSAHLKSVKALKEALAPLYASFSDEQKKVADSTMIGPMGMM